MKLKRWLVFALFLLVSACATAPQPAAPQSVSQGILYADGLLTAAAQSADNALNVRTLSTADAQKVNAIIQTANTALEAARTANAAGNASGAQANLQMANAAITQLQQYLLSKGVK